MIHPQLAFSFFEALFDRPPHDGGLTHLRERPINGCIGEGKFGFPIRAGSDEEPHGFLLGQALSGWINPEAGHLSDDWPLGAFGQNDRLPAAFARACKGGYGFGLRLTG